MRDREPLPPGQTLHEAQRDRILEYFANSKGAINATFEDVKKWVDNLLVHDPDAFLPGLFSDNETDIPQEEYVLDSEHIEEIRQEHKEERKKWWLVSQCLRYRDRLAAERTACSDSPSSYVSRGRDQSRRGGRRRVYG